VVENNLHFEYTSVHTFLAAGYILQLKDDTNEMFRQDLESGPGGLDLDKKTLAVINQTELENKTLSDRLSKEMNSFCGYISYCKHKYIPVSSLLLLLSEPGKAASRSSFPKRRA
jgi:hypothetical protein